MIYAEAKTAVQGGKIFRRKAWPENMVIFLEPRSTFTVDWFPGLRKLYKRGTDITYRDRIDAVWTDGTIGSWTPTHHDEFADDWVEVILDNKITSCDTLKLHVINKEGNSEVINFRSTDEKYIDIYCDFWKLKLLRVEKE